MPRDTSGAKKKSLEDYKRHIESVDPDMKKATDMPKKDPEAQRMFDRLTPADALVWGGEYEQRINAPEHDRAVAIEEAGKRVKEKAVKRYKEYLSSKKEDEPKEDRRSTHPEH